MLHPLFVRTTTQTALNPSTDPTDKSNPPLTNANVIAIAIIALQENPIAVVRKLVTVRNAGDKTDINTTSTKSITNTENSFMERIFFQTEFFDPCSFVVATVFILNYYLSLNSEIVVNI